MRIPGTERSSTVVASGIALLGAAATIGYRRDDDDDVRLLSKMLIAEFVAQWLWAGTAG